MNTSHSNLGVAGLDNPNPLPAPTNWHKLVTTPPPPRDFVIGGLPAGGFGLLAGADGAGKSFLSLQFAVAVAAGLPVAGGAVPAPAATGPVLYLGGEDSTADLHLRINNLVKAYSSSLQNDEIKNRIAEADVRYFCLSGERLPLLLSNVNGIGPTPAVKNLMELMSGARLTILDPLVMFHNLKENDNSEMDRLGRLLSRLARRTGGAILVVHHTGQEALMNSRDDHQIGRGATAITAAARAVWTLRRPNQKEKKLIESDNDDPARWVALRGPKVTHGPEMKTAWLRKAGGGVPMLADPPWAEKLEEKKGRKRNGNIYNMGGHPYEKN